MKKVTNMVGVARSVPSLLALALAQAVTGCFCVDVGRSPALGPEVEEHVSVSNYGWTLFGCIPVVCGNRNEDSWCPFAFFRDDLRPEYAYGKIAKRAEEKNCELKNVFFVRDNDVLFDAYYAPVPWVIVYKEVDVSANLVRKGDAK